MYYVVRTMFRMCNNINETKKIYYFSLIISCSTNLQAYVCFGTDKSK